MYPDLFSIGPVTIHSYGLFVALGFAAALLVTVWIGKAEGMHSPQVVDMGFIMIIWAIIGSRLMYLVLNISYYANHPLEILKIWEGGLVFSGGLVFAVLALIWYAWRRHLSFWAIADLWTPAVALGQGIGRIGCFMAGCCYGKMTDMPWGIVFSHPQSLAPHHVPLHPTQLYASLSGFVIFVCLLLFRTRKQFNGQLLLWYLILHSTTRLLIERFRDDYRGLIPGTEMSLTQLTALLLLLGAAATLFFLKTKRDGKNR